MMGGGGATYQVTQTTPSTGDTKAESAQKTVDAEAQKKGRTSTILTSGSGASGTAPTSKKTLLGQ